MSLKYENFAPIVEAYQQAGVELNPALSWAAQRVAVTDTQYTFSPSHAVFALGARIGQLGGTLFSDERTVFEDASVEADTDSTGNQLIELINSTVSQDQLCMPDAVFQSDKIAKTHNCGWAECCFAATVAGMADETERYLSGEPDDKTDYGFRIFTGDDGRPLMLQKFEGKPTTLALERVQLNGMIVPPGTLLRVNTQDEAHLARLTMDKDYPKPLNPGIMTEPVDSIDTIGAVRLSLFAAPRAERDKLLYDNGRHVWDYQIAPAADDVLHTVDIVEIRQTVMETLDLIEQHTATA